MIVICSEKKGPKFLLRPMENVYLIRDLTCASLSTRSDVFHEWYVNLFWDHTAGVAGGIIYSNAPGIYVMVVLPLSFMPFYHFFKLSLCPPNPTPIFLAATTPVVTFSFYKQTKNRNETGSNLRLGTCLTVLSKRLGRKRCCDAKPGRCHRGVSSHYLCFAL